MSKFSATTDKVVVLKQQLKEAQNAAKMIVEVTDVEIKSAMFDIDSNKADGPDGFTSSLVPKIDTPDKVSDFRPIACCNVLYKCISKILTNRIKEGLSKIVNLNQSAFIHGRYIQDNIMITQELLNGYNRKQGAKRVAMKIDIQKAYDTISWDFLKSFLILAGFHDTMVNWIMTCISSASFLYVLMVRMDDPNMTMEEYIKFEEEKAHRRGQVFNWKTTTYGKIRVDDDLYDLRSIEAEFPTIIIDDTITPQDALLCKSQVNFENEFPAIVYNDAQTSKSDLLTEPILNPQHIDEFNLKDETSLSECDEEEQNVLNFNDLFPFNVIYPDELKKDTDNDNDKVDIEHSSGDLSV
ncbi:RNA-directed DNA polymerase, eukaryota, reverse transcriptase zinc-binding domain protein [Tanacetum coccineum]|uniref:RNA-directed DNA polymerase, eukaryota, reverse transcriptase zinc-binding domain protein n=1 Tax=Tanacetum coccineum TaxID=301880 RepID=A0ABQ5HEF4_9ASTR